MILSAVNRSGWSRSGCVFGQVLHASTAEMCARTRSQTLFVLGLLHASHMHLAVHNLAVLTIPVFPSSLSKAGQDVLNIFSEFSMKTP